MKTAAAAVAAFALGALFGANAVFGWLESQPDHEPELASSNR